MAIPDQDWEIVENMSKYGGSFVQQLAHILYQADHINYAKLKNAFPEYFEEYRKFPPPNSPHL